MWTDDVTAVKMFNDGVLASIMKDEHYSKLTGEELQSKITDLQARFFLENKPLSSYDNPYAALQAFNEWLELSSMVLKAATFQMIITRTYGSTTVTYGMEGNFDSSTPTNRQRGYQFLERIVEGQHAMWAAKHAQAGSVTGASGTAAGQGNNFTYEEMAVEKIVVSHDGKQQQVRVFGGKWSKFGVIVWPEVIDKTGYIKAADLPLGEKAYSGTAKVQMQDGKPRKVVELQLF